jgi:membrane-associated phospholipid phosphatase
MTSQTTSEIAPWRRLFGVALAVAVAFGVLMAVTAVVADLPLRDPDGLFGPSYVRLPLIALIMMGLDVVPRVLNRRRRAPDIVRITINVVRERWSGPRLLVAAAGLASFYISYVAYRNLKSFLPFVREDLTDAWLVGNDRWFALGGHPGDLLHDVLGTGISADVLSFVYMIFLPFVPFSLAAALIWSDNLLRGAWYATALCFNWILGTASYYLLPSLGPIYVEPYRFADLPATPVSALQDALWSNRVEVLADPHATQAVHGIAAFASLHTSIVFTAALVASLSGMRLLVQYLLWAFFALTALATVYFGWHYVIDVFAGLVVGGLAVWLAALAVGRIGSRQQVHEPQVVTA